MFETETDVGPSLVRKLKWLGHGPTGTPSDYTPVKHINLIFDPVSYSKMEHQAYGIYFQIVSIHL